MFQVFVTICFHLTSPFISDPDVAESLDEFECDSLPNVHPDFFGLVFPVYVRQLPETKAVVSGRVDEAVNRALFVDRVHTKRLPNLEQKVSNLQRVIFRGDIFKVIIFKAVIF